MKGGMNRYRRGGFRLRSDGSPVVNTRLTRRRFLGTAAAGVAAAGLEASGVAHARRGDPSDNPAPELITNPEGDPAVAGDCEIWVYGSQANPDDALHLQWAVDYVAEGGVVRLFDVFYLADVEMDPVDPTGYKVLHNGSPPENNPGNDQTIYITKDVHIYGNNAKLVGGLNTLSLGVPKDTWVFDMFANDFYSGVLYPVEVTIMGVEFVKPLNNAIAVTATKEDSVTKIMDNVFTDGRPLQWWWGGYPIARAIVCQTPFSVNYFDPDNLFPRAPAGSTDPNKDSTLLKGTIIVKKNEMDGKGRVDPDDPWSVYQWDAYWNGMSHFIFPWHVDADLEISENTINNYNGPGMGFGGLFKTTSVRGNTITIQPVSWAGGLAMLIAEDGYARTLFGYPISEGDSEKAKTFVTDNPIISQNPEAWVIDIFPKNKDVVVARNKISGSGFIGIALEVIANKNTVERNSIEGSFTLPVYVAGSCENNLFVNNHINVSQPGLAHFGFFAGSYNNLVIVDTSLPEFANTYYTWYDEEWIDARKNTGNKIVDWANLKTDNSLINNAWGPVDPEAVRQRNRERQQLMEYSSV